VERAIADRDRVDGVGAGNAGLTPGLRTGGALCFSHDVSQNLWPRSRVTSQQWPSSLVGGLPVETGGGIRLAPESGGFCNRRLTD